MQQQTTADPTNLQQPRSDLQSGAGNLQTGSGLGSGAGTSLNQTPAGQQLVVETQGQPLNTPLPASTPAGGPSPWLLLLALPILVVIAVFWPKGSRQATPTEALTEIVPEPVAAPIRPKRKKSTKKSAKRGKSKRR